MREPCIYCVRKHLAQAVVLLCESRKGYPENLLFAIGHMAEAEDEAPTEELANEIRDARIDIEGNRDRGIILLTILNKVQKMIDDEMRGV